MRRTDRLFEIIQILRSQTRSITAIEIAERLEVSVRTIYRDIQALQAMRTPIDGEAGVGYMMRQGYDLPPINFSEDEIESIVVGLSLLSRTGDPGLLKSAQQVLNKIDHSRDRLGRLQVSNWNPQKGSGVDPEILRMAIRNEQKIKIHYENAQNEQTQRVLLPISLIYYIEVIVLVAWCELRHDFRHFRLDRIRQCVLHSVFFKSRGQKLRLQLQSLEE